ncbi:RNA pseudouridine synthase 3, mitochondrial isoform X1 [Ananas comosus]|uniref:RNA pseudouridine synthase 3, mitochondrial isoform X1 n=1 Tax=Ananas comosus TaxID=4615 RepID=A0A6P5GSH8_ANACO|nr:RNA pseudouridine synthase 3, mitochondrial isoform X1 [Ananas comosus]
MLRRCRLCPPAALLAAARSLSRLAPPPPARAEPVIRVSNNVARLGEAKEGPKPRQLLSLPRFPSSSSSSCDRGDPLPGRKRDPSKPRRVTAISWVKHYFADIPQEVIQAHFNKGLVHVECPNNDVSPEKGHQQSNGLRKIKHNAVMEAGMRIHLPISVAETKITKRYDTIPTATLNPNADEIEYIRRLVIHRDSAIIVLNKPPKVPVKGHLPVHNSMDVLAAAALSYGNEQGPQLVHRLDRESSGLLLLGRTKESYARLHWLFTSISLAKSSSEMWNNACEATMQRYWALVIGTPKEKEGVISAPLSKVFLNDGKMERVILAHPSGIDGSQDAVTEYRVMGPTINGCSWIELRPLTGRKHQEQHEILQSRGGFGTFNIYGSLYNIDVLRVFPSQLRVHCAEALGTPIVGDYKYGWFVHQRWKQMPRLDYAPLSGTPYKLRRPEGLEVQKGSALSKVPLLHLHCREMVIPNIAKFLSSTGEWHDEGNPWSRDKPDLLRFVAPMPSHMKISWNIMSSYLV